MNIILNEIKASSIITKSNLPDADYVINPYIGCTHGCIYCYARFMKRFTGHKEEWGKFIDVKVNAADLVPLKTNKYLGKSVFLSSVTDPYIPIERKYKLTRGILEKLVSLNPNLGVQTKSDLVVRDIDILKKFKNCEVGFTITTMNDVIRKEVEPFTSSVQERVNALKQLKEAGIKTYVFVGPILPYLTDWKAIINYTKDYSDMYMFENLNIAGTIWSSVKKWFEDKHPELLPKYEQIYFSKSDYWGMVADEIKQFCRKEGVVGRLYFDHGE